jgi:hypothetical protein
VAVAATAKAVDEVLQLLFRHLLNGASARSFKVRPDSLVSGWENGAAV